MKNEQHTHHTPTKGQTRNPSMEGQAQHASTKENHYKHLTIMAILSFICMYILMYAMVNTFSNVFPNINQFYMAALMTMPMIVIELLIMRHMFMNKKLNAIIITVAAIGLIVFYLCADESQIK